MKRYTDEELHALQLTSDIRTGSISGLHDPFLIVEGGDTTVVVERID